MKNYVNLALKKEKKAVSFEKVCERIEKIALKDDPDFTLTNDMKKEIKSILDNGVKKYEYYLSPSNNYTLMSKTSFRKGRFVADRNGNGVVSVTTSYTDKENNNVVRTDKYVINKENARGAIDGDIVLIDFGGKSGDCKVEKILDRHIESVVGEVYRMGASYFVRPIDKKKQDLTIALEGEAIEGQRVSVDLTKQTGDNFYIGTVTRVFNHKDDPDEDVLWEAFKLGIDDQFSKESWEQVKHIPTSVRDIDKIGREDLTDWEIFTIDGADTKDIDDAVSCTRLPNGNFQLGVHIADVSNYVPENSALDKDAFRKGTSNYLVGRVIPMLPHELSNGICSLNPQVERLALSCIMEINPNGEVVNSRLTESVIKSRIKMTYDKVNDILKEGKVAPEYEEHADTLRNLNKLALILRKKRLKNGAIEFDRPELKVILGEDGKVKDFSLRIQDLGENLIEEHMLITNETVDKFLEAHGFPCLHRVHAAPSADRLNELLMFLEAINYPFKENVSGDAIAEKKKLMQELVDHVNKAGRLSPLLSTMLIRCNSRAKYSPINIGHYGLAKKNYCHFTSPIRRYPDLTNHRMIKDVLHGNNKKIKKWQEKLPEIGGVSSSREKTADEAEQNTLRMKCCEYMEEHIGDEFNGTVIGISDKGITVELDNMIEGFIRLKDLKGEYVYSSESFSMVSLEGFDNYYVGDRLRLKVSAASKEDKKINFSVVEKLEENKTVNADSINRDVKVFAKMNK